MVKQLLGYIVALLIVITMFAFVLQDLNEQIYKQNLVIESLKEHTHEMESTVKVVEPHTHNNEDLVKLEDYEAIVRNINWQLKAIEERVVEIQARLSP